jgi:hypothetical protein
MDNPKVYADFHNADANGCLRLNCVGTIEDLARQRITLRHGLRLTLYADDLDANGQFDELQVEGVVSFSEPEHCWVASIDWSAIHHASDEHPASVGRNGPASEGPTDDDSRTRRSS